MARIRISGGSGASENTIVFFPAGGHSHDGLNSSLISTEAYSLYDFTPSFVNNTQNQTRSVRQENNRIAFESLIVRIVNQSVLDPAGIRLTPGTLNGSVIISNTITASQLAANTITADQISANTITADELFSDIILVNNIIRSNVFVSGPGGYGWKISNTGDAEFNQITIRGNVFSNSGEIGGWTLENTKIFKTTIDSNNFTQTLSLNSSGVNLNTDVYNWSNSPVISMISNSTSNSSVLGASYHAPSASFYFANSSVDMNAATYIRPYAIHLRDGELDTTTNHYFGGYIDQGSLTTQITVFGSNSQTVHTSGVGGGGGSSASNTTSLIDTSKTVRLALIEKFGTSWSDPADITIQNYVTLSPTYTHIGKKIASPGGALIGPLTFMPNAVATNAIGTGDFLLSYKSDGSVTKIAANTLTVSSATSATSAGSVPASGITGQTGMWTSAARPGPYRLYRRDNDSDYSVQTYYTGARWRLYGYNGDSEHADTHVGYADAAGSAATAGSATTAGSTGTLSGGTVKFVGDGSSGAATFWIHDQANGGSTDYTQWTSIIQSGWLSSGPNPYTTWGVVRDGFKGYISQYYSGDSYSSRTITGASDRRVKDNIQPISSAIDVLKMIDIIEPKIYDYLHYVTKKLDQDGNATDEDSDIPKKFGFIAQELQSALGEYGDLIVNEIDDPRYDFKLLTTEDRGLLAIMWEAIRQLNNKIKTLEAK